MLTLLIIYLIMYYIMSSIKFISKEFAKIKYNYDFRIWNSLKCMNTIINISLNYLLYNVFNTIYN